ncbi:DUF4386 domain-containing protein [Candidatus Margulisiibacteriota bacterium]
MTNRIADMSQKTAVTILRFLYPIWAVVGLFGVMYVPTTIMVAGDAAATANNLLANGLLFRLGIAGSLITQLIHIAVVALLYVLFKSVNKNQALLLVVLGLVGVPISMLNTLNRVAALVVLNGADYLKVFNADQLQALALFFLNLNAEGLIIAGIFWGLWLFPLAYLISKSGYFPKILGVLMLIAGFGYVLDSSVHFLLPSYKEIFLVVTPILTIGEIIFMIWVMLRGACLERTSAASESRG